MSIRHGLLALLERGQMYGYQLRAAFEESTGSTWPLNIGQVYTTLTRLERDGLVRPLPEREGGQRPYEITDAGRADLALWFATPISRTDRPRDELAIKLALALTTPGVDVAVGGADPAQRHHAGPSGVDPAEVRQRPAGGPPWRLVLDSMVFQAEAEVRWLDHCETSLVRHQPSARRLPLADPMTPTPGRGSMGRRGGKPVSGSDDAVLELRDVHRTHGDGQAAVHALRGVSLVVRPASWSP